MSSRKVFIMSQALYALQRIGRFIINSTVIDSNHNTNWTAVKRIWYLSPMRAARVQASLRIRAVSPEPPLLAHTSSESKGTFRQKARSLAPLSGWACAVKIYHDGMLEDTNLLDGAQFIFLLNIFNSYCLSVWKHRRLFLRWAWLI